MEVWTSVSTGNPHMQTIPIPCVKRGLVKCLHDRGIICSQDIEVDHLARGRILTQSYMECKGHVAVLLLSELPSIFIYLSTYVACAYYYLITYLSFSRCLGIVLIATSELALLGVFHKGELRPQRGDGAPAQTNHITFVECEGERNAGFGREKQRTTPQLKLGSSMHGMGKCSCTLDYMAPFIIII